MNRFIGIAAIVIAAQTSPLHAESEGHEGITAPYRIIEIATQETGVVQHLTIKAGDAVKQDDVVAILDNSMIKASIAIAQARMQAKAALNGATARYDMNRNRLTKLKELERKGSARADEIEQAHSTLAISRAELDSQKEALTIAELEYQRLETQLQRRTIRSPIDGVVVSIDREPGELVDSAQSIVARIAELDRLNLIAHLPQISAETLTLGNAITVRLNSGNTLNGVVDFISPVVDPRSGTVEVKIMIENYDRKVRSGMRARVLLDEPKTLSSASD